MTTQKTTADEAGSLILLRITTCLGLSPESKQETWKEILQIANENANDFESLHDLYRLLDASASDSPSNPWYQARDIVGEEIVRSESGWLPGTYMDPTDILRNRR